MKKWFYKLASISFLIILVSCSGKELKRKKKNTYTGPQMVAYNIDMYVSDEAKPSMKMKAKKQLVYQSEDQEFPEGFHVEFFNEKEQVYSKLISKTAYFNKIKNEWKLTGDVLVENFEKGQKLETQEMFWNIDNGNIFVEKKHPVKITEPDQVLNGMGLTAKDDFSYYKITKPTGFTFI